MRPSININLTAGYHTGACPTIATERGGSLVVHSPADHGHGANPKYPPEIKADLANEECMICERRFGQHSYKEFEHCLDEIVERARRNLGA
jgi:hypothetical protein